jgi:hypothetical protein
MAPKKTKKTPNQTRNIEPSAESPDTATSAMLANTTFLDESEIGPAPAGFEDIYAERVLGWFVTVAGNAIQGVLRDTFETTSKFRKTDGSNKKKVYKIEVTNPNPLGPNSPTIYMPADSEEPETETGKAAVVGDLIGVDERGWLKSLSKVAVGQEVWIVCQGKEPSSANYPQGAWKFIVRAKPADDINEVTGEVKSKR